MTHTGGDVRAHCFAPFAASCVLSFASIVAVRIHLKCSPPPLPLGGKKKHQLPRSRLDLDTDESGERPTTRPSIRQLRQRKSGMSGATRRAPVTTGLLTRVDQQRQDYNPRRDEVTVRPKTNESVSIERASGGEQEKRGRMRWRRRQPQPKRKSAQVFK